MDGIRAKINQLKKGGFENDKNRLVPKDNFYYYRNLSF